jgi:hypothetical protein
MPKKARKGKFKNKGGLAIKPVPAATAEQQPMPRANSYQPANIRRPGVMAIEDMTNRLAHAKPELKRIATIGAAVLVLIIITCVLIS